MMFKDIHCHILPGIDDGSRSIEESYTLPTNVSKEGYVFAAWYEAEDYSGDSISIIKSGEGNKVVYAKWTERDDIKINYNLNGGKWKDEENEPKSTRKYTDNTKLPTKDDIEK